LLSSFCEKFGGSRNERKLLSAKVLVSIQVDEKLFLLAKVDLTVAVLKTQISGTESCSFCEMGLSLTFLCLSIFING